MFYRLLVISMLFATESLAQQPWSVEATYNVPVGQVARLYFKPAVTVKRLKVTLTQEDGSASHSFKAGKLSPGSRKTFKFPVPEGRSRWNAAFDATVDDGGLTSTFRFEVISVGPLKVNLEKSGVDLGKGRLLIQTNQRLASASLKGFNPSGDVILDDEVDLPDTKGTVPVEFSPIPEGDLRRLEIKVTDPHGRCWIPSRPVRRDPPRRCIFATGQLKSRPLSQANERRRSAYPVGSEDQKDPRSRGCGSQSQAIDRGTDTVGSARTTFVSAEIGQNRSPGTSGLKA